MHTSLGRLGAIALLAASLSLGCSRSLPETDPDAPLRTLTGDTLHSRLDPHDVFVRLDTLSPKVYFIFSADSMFEGAPVALEAMAERGIKASFFFTGNYLRDSAHVPVINRIIKEGHYVGPHSDGHILLADWDRGRTPLVTPDSLIADLKANLRELARFGVTVDSIPFALPPFEWCNRSQAHVYRSVGIAPINPSPEIETYRDYTTPDMPYYWTAERMLTQLFDCEREHGLRGAIIIIHLGTQDARPDKLYNHLPAIFDTLTARGYTPVPLPRK